MQYKNTYKHTTSDKYHTSTSSMDSVGEEENIQMTERKDTREEEWYELQAN